MTDFHGLENIINQLVFLHQDGDAMGRAIVDSLAADWSMTGCLWIEGINQKGRNDLPKIIVGNGQSASFLPVQSAEEILRQPLIQSILSPVNASGEETPQVIALSEEAATVLPIPLVSGLGMRTQFKGVVNGLLIVSYDQPHHWTDEEIIHFQKIVAPLFAIATRLQEIDNEQSQLLKLPDAAIATFSDQTRNPLARIRVAVELLGQSELAPEKKQSCLDSVIKACFDLQEIINNIINHQKT